MFSPPATPPRVSLPNSVLSLSLSQNKSKIVKTKNQNKHTNEE